MICFSDILTALHLLLITIKLYLMKAEAKLVIISLIFIVFCFVNAYAQLSLDAEYRPRFELRDGYRSLNEQEAMASFIVSQRTRLNLTYNHEKFKLVFTPQDVRVWGDEQLSSSTGVYGDDASLDLHQAFIEVKMFEKSSLSIGRQVLAYDDEWLLSKRNWNQNGLAYDAVVFKMKPADFDIHLGASWNSLSETTSDNYYPSNRIKSLNFLWVNKKINEKQNISLLHITTATTKTDSTNALCAKHTSGLYTKYHGDNLEYRLNAYYQYGKNNSGRNVSAFLADADLALKLGKFKPGIGGSYLSGNKKLTGTDHLFDILYGARHRHFGHMDYFRDIPSHTNQGGLTDLYAYVGYKINKKMSLKNITHYFMLSELNSSTPGDKKLGLENETELKWEINDWSSLKLAYLLYSATESFQQLQGVNNNNFAQFAFLEWTFTPALINEK